MSETPDTAGRPTKPVYAVTLPDHLPQAQFKAVADRLTERMREAFGDVVVVILDGGATIAGPFLPAEPDEDRESAATEQALADGIPEHLLARRKIRDNPQA